MLSAQVEKLLPHIQKPGRYTGGELHSVVKDKNAVDIRFAFCFPDTYEIGMSHLGMKILYALANRREDTWCERVFAPWVDMEDLMRREGVPLFALESGDPIAAFDVLGFTLQYELSYTNVLNMLDLAGIPLRAEDRPSLTPLIIGGGPCACNPEPMAPFFDLFLPGEGEEVLGDVLDLLKACKARGDAKQTFFEMAAEIDGVYVPSLYETSYNDDGTVNAYTAIPPAPATVKKRLVKDLDSMFVPDTFVVPFLEIVHDRATAELFRGCIRGCRFCQAGFLYRPVRERSPESVNAQCRALCASTGYDEVSLCSLSTSDYTRLDTLLTDLLDWSVPEKVNISLPSLRADNFPESLMSRLTAVRRSGLTFAPEAGTQRLRDAINKNITEDEILEAARKAFAGGWTAVKLYFMLGLPTETEEDLDGIAELAQKVVDEFYKNPDKPKGKGVTVSVSVSCFVPKPHTPFQWEPQDGIEDFRQKQEYLKTRITTRKINLSVHNPETSALEAAFARGDRRLASVIEAAWKKGCRFDGWDDQFRMDMWIEAFEQVGLSPAFYANRRRDTDELLPWAHLDYGVSAAFLKKERENAYTAVTTPHCREQCAGCGANTLSGGACR